MRDMVLTFLSSLYIRPLKTLRISIITLSKEGKLKINFFITGFVNLHYLVRLINFFSFVLGIVAYID